ncbi:unnamed protein product [Musa textilis]
MIQVTDAFDVSADDDNDGEPSHFIAAQQQRDAAKKIHGPTGTPPATKVLKRLWEKDTCDAQGRVKKASVTMDHSMVIWVRVLRSVSVPSIEDPGQFPVLCGKIYFSSFYRGSWTIPNGDQHHQKGAIVSGHPFALQVVDGKRKSVSPEGELLIEEKLKLLNKPAVKSIKLRW